MLMWIDNCSQCFFFGAQLPEHSAFCCSLDIMVVFPYLYQSDLILMLFLVNQEVEVHPRVHPLEDLMMSREMLLWGRIPHLDSVACVHHLTPQTKNLCIFIIFAFSFTECGRLKFEFRFQDMEIHS